SGYPTHNIMATSAVSNLPEYAPCGSSARDPWYLVQSKPCQEMRAEQTLTRFCSDVFVPRYAPIKAKPLQRKPFFPGYLFARFPMELFTTVGNSFGVSRIVRFGAEVARVPHQVVREIESRLAVGDLAIERETKFHAGDRVKVIEGPMRGFYAVFDYSLSDGDRVRILLDTVSRMPVEVGRDDLMLL